MSTHQIGRSQSLSIRTGLPPYQPQRMSQMSAPSLPVAYKKRIPEEKIRKAVKLYRKYQQEEGLARLNAQNPHGRSHLDVPYPTMYSGTSTTSSPSRGQNAPSISTSANDAGDMTSVISFTGSEISTNEHIAYNGQRVKNRTRKRLTPLARAKAALVRHLGACANCKARAVSCSMEHHDLEMLENEARNMLTRSLHDGSGSSMSISPKEETNNGQFMQSSFQTDNMAFYPSHLTQQSLGDGLDHGLALDLAQISNEVTGHDPSVAPLTPTLILPRMTAPTSYLTSDMIHIGDRGHSDTTGFYFDCAWRGCPVQFRTRRELETHFEQRHEEFERLPNPDYNVCINCRGLNQETFQPYCICGGAIQMRILGRRLSIQNDERHYPDNEAVLADINNAYPRSPTYFQPTTNPFMGAAGPGMDGDPSDYEHSSLGGGFDHSDVYSNPESGQWGSYLAGSYSQGSQGYQYQGNSYSQFNLLAESACQVLSSMRKGVAQIRRYKTVFLFLGCLLLVVSIFACHAPIDTERHSQEIEILFQSPKLGFLGLIGPIPLVWSLKHIIAKRSRSRRFKCPLRQDYPLSREETPNYQYMCTPKPTDDTLPRFSGIRAVITGH